MNKGFFFSFSLDKSMTITLFNIPNSLDELAEKGEKGYLALKIVEIIGEDDVNNLDPETIYFITNLLNKLDLKEFRNDILATALPLRI